jgi:hypothetical protein
MPRNIQLIHRLIDRIVGPYRTVRLLGERGRAAPASGGETRGHVQQSSIRLTGRSPFLDSVWSFWTLVAD